MPLPINTKRLSCPKCLRPQNTCICHWITTIEHAIEVLFLQHPLEISNPKGSARLLHLSLPRSRLVTGETFSEVELHALLYAPFDKSDGGKVIQPILLYPDTSEDGRIEKSPAFIPPSSDAAIQYRLIVLDGTWRKSRKMLYLNRLLQQLPRLPLSDLPASHYRIRKAHKPDQLSSYEATCHALMQLEKNAEKYQPLLAAFDGFVAQQQAYANMK
jgi:DTW domain-containing protein YfiP